MNHKTRWAVVALTLILSLVALAGCGAGDDAADAVADHAKAAADHVSDHAEAAVDKVASAVEATPAVNAVLAKVDLVDGTEDHVVAKCPGCALAMEGSADHAMQVGDYSLHFCSDECKDRFGENAATAILELPTGGEAGATAD